QTHIALASLEIIAIGVAVFSAVQEIRSPDADEGQTIVDRTDLFIGGVMLLEWYYSLSTGHKWFSPIFMTAIASLFLSFARGRIRARRMKRRQLRIDDDGIHCRARRNKFEIAWSELDSVEVINNELVFKLKNGTTHQLLLTRYHNAE